MSERNLNEEVLDLASQVADYVQYLKDMGIQYLGHAELSAPAHASSTEQSEQLASAESPPDLALDRPKTQPGPATTISSIPPRERERQTTISQPEPDINLFGEVMTVKGESPVADFKEKVGPYNIPVLERLPAAATLDAIRDDIGDCKRCKLCEHRTKIVFGEGNPKARLMFVGEGPGADEDVTGRPFVGRAGKLLDKVIESIGFRRQDVYIANVVKCRPPENRTPERDEVAICEPFLFRQIAVIRPSVIVALGAPALQCLFGNPRDAITRVRGEWRDWNGIKVMATFHPAYLLRSPDKKRETWEDMKKVRDYLLLLD